MSAKTYVVYRGDDVVAVGLLAEVAARMGVKEETVRYLASPKAHRAEGASARPRMVAEVVEEDE